MATDRRPTTSKGRGVNELVSSIEAVAAEMRFSGVVRVDIDGGDGDGVEFLRAYGMANRSSGVPMTVDCQFGIASGTKGLTALTVVSLIEAGDLALTTTARSVLGGRLPSIGGDVTVEHLLAHRSGIGDYLDEDAGHEVTDYVMPVPVHELATTEQYVRLLDARPAKFASNSEFSYCNSGYVVLALIAELATGASFYDLVDQRVCVPAGMRATAFLRSDELPGRAAVGYLHAEGLRTNVLHLPVRGSGDGGIYSTAADIHAFWTSFFAGRIVANQWISEMLRLRSADTKQRMGYGLGFWLHDSTHAAILEGSDAGVSFRSAHDPARRITYTVLSNTSEGAWPVARCLERLLTG